MLQSLIKKFKKDKYLFVIVILLAVGGFLRFVNLSAFVTFLGDQARDAIVLKRMVTFEHFPAIGPVSSVGNVYLGPFYYYFIAPWLLIWNFDPIGPALGVALFSTLFIPVNYFIVKYIFDKDTALLSSILITFSFVLIDFSRFSWNPNLLPLFSLITVFLFIKAYEKKNNLYFALGGAFLAFCVQLHYLALFLIAAAAVFSVKKIWEDKKNLKKYIPGLLYSIGAFIFFSIPLILFDLRHNFLNSKSFITLFQSSGNVASDKLSNFLTTGYFLDKYAFAAETGLLSWIPFVLSILLALTLVFKGNKKISGFFVFYLISVIGISLYGGPKYPHYFAMIYPFYYITAAYLIASLPKKMWGYLLMLLFTAGFVFVNTQKYYFLGNGGSYQIEKAKKLAGIIGENVTTDKYTLTAIPEVYSDHTARYFLEVRGKRPQERNSTEKTSELFVICEKPCKPIGDPLYDIAVFAPRKIVGEWKVDDVTIYKLTR